MMAVDRRYVCGGCGGVCGGCRGVYVMCLYRVCRWVVGTHDLVLYFLSFPCMLSFQFFRSFKFSGTKCFILPSACFLDLADSLILTFV